MCEHLLLVKFLQNMGVAVDVTMDTQELRDLATATVAFRR